MAAFFIDYFHVQLMAEFGQKYFGDLMLIKLNVYVYTK